MNENLKALDAAIEADEELRAAFLAAVEGMEGDDMTFITKGAKNPD